MKTWWYRPQGFTNFGDELGHIFLAKLGIKTEWAPLSDAEILTTGSILQRHNIEPLRDGTILWGTGWHREAIRSVPHFDIRAVRGALTAGQVNAKASTLYGDPGLLASAIWPNYGKKKHKLGFVRHYVDRSTHIPEAFLIDPTWPAEEVCRAISSCETIVSSSLHGCIVAASYGIPYMRLPHSQVVGGDVKWIDFATSLTKPIPEIQQELIEGITK